MMVRKAAEATHHAGRLLGTAQRLLLKGTARQSGGGERGSNGNRSRRTRRFSISGDGGGSGYGGSSSTGNLQVRGTVGVGGRGK